MQRSAKIRKEKIMGTSVSTVSTNIPAHIAARMARVANIPDRVTVPSLTFTGKTWTININGEAKQLMREIDGEEVPVSVMNAVILDYAKTRGRAYYEGQFDAKNPGRPKCWSADGKVPHESVTDKQAQVCNVCEWSKKGSKMNDQGQSITACSQYRLIALVPANRLDFTPLRMKIAVTSDWDDQSPDLKANGWFGFKNYIDHLVANKENATSMLVTKMKFDPNVAYPKIIFSRSRWLEEHEADIIEPVALSEEVKRLISGEFSPEGADGVPTAAPAKPVEVAPARPLATAKPVKDAATPEDDDGDFDIPVTTKPAAKPVKAAPPPEDDDGDFDIPVAPKPTPRTPPAGASAKPVKPSPAKAAAKPIEAVAVKAVPAEVAAMLDEWGDED